MRNRHLGKFYVTGSLVENGELWRVLSLMEFVPTRAEYLWANDAFEYIGMSPMFEEVKEGQIIPEYVVGLNQFDNKVSVTLRTVYEDQTN